MRMFAFSLILILFNALYISAQTPFRASYKLLLDGNGYYSGYDMSIGSAALSGDGSTILAYTYYYYGSQRNLFIINTTSAVRTDIALDVTASWGVVGASMAISDNGTVAFIADTGRDSIFRVESGVMTKIFDMSDWASINRVEEIRTTSNGDWVYFREDRDDIWKLPKAGGAPIRVVNDSEVARNGGSGRMISGFDISDHGDTVVFSLLGYEDGTRSYVSNPEIFVLDGGGFRQLTNDSPTSWKTVLNLSGDGSMAVFYDQVSNYWTTIQIANGHATLLYPTDYNVAGADLPTDGSHVFFNQNDLEGGRLIHSNGSNGIGIFPQYPIHIGATYWPQISGDGTLVSFISTSRLLYIGELWVTDSLNPGPTIETINFEPPRLPDNDPGASIVLTAFITDPQGVDNIARTSVSHWINNELNEDWSNIPVHFNFDPDDDGVFPDVIAGDGLFSTSGVCAGGYPNVEDVTIRVGAQDHEGNVFVRDARFYICPTLGCDIFFDGFESGDTSAWTVMTTH